MTRSILGSTLETVGWRSRPVAAQQREVGCGSRLVALKGGQRHYCVIKLLSTVRLANRVLYMLSRM